MTMTSVIFNAFQPFGTGHNTTLGGLCRIVRRIFRCVAFDVNKIGVHTSYITLQARHPANIVTALEGYAIPRVSCGMANA